MDALELLDIVSSGETSKVQFKEKLPHQDSIAAEMVAMSNSLGGIILIGVEDKGGEIKGLNNDEIRDYSSRIGNVASNLVNDPIYVTTEIVNVENGDSKKILVIKVPEGTNRPYMDNNGTIWVKQGADKRKVTDKSEIKRLFQKSGNLLADEMEVFGSSIDDINRMAFEEHFLKEFGKTIEERGLSYEQGLKAKRVILNNKLTLAGLLFFGKDPQFFKPTFTIKTVSFFGNSISGNQYRNKPQDLTGTIPELYYTGINFLKSNLKYVQEEGTSFNQQGVLEVSEIALEELLQNALIHRDYFKSSPVRIMIFDDRIEIVSPGPLPNSLTVETMIYDNPVPRNHLIVSYSRYSLPYSGLGSGIKRALEHQPSIKFVNDTEGEQFKVIIPREQ